MATIKPIEGKSVHQIQSGQVIVDLCSVVKELVENSLDAGATSIDVRFRNQGLDSIEVQDNGGGISPQNYETLALKHYTSKLSTYSDLTTLQTFGFRGEALSSLCALSNFTVTTCMAADAPKGTKLEFEVSGKLKGTSIVAAQKGTTVAVENLFNNLPVRRRELERKIKQEWARVVGILGQYACIQTGIKFSVTQQTTAKGKKTTLFSTKGNPSTKENIVNVFGAKTLAALVPLDLKLDLEPTSGPNQKWSTREDGGTKEIRIVGHISRPAFGEGRQTPDRQMFFVNARPCGLPQVAKAFNEVYKSYNASQSPFIFANIELDTHLYDVNVSPDKRTIMLHDQTRMLESLKTSLTTLFETQDYTVPISQLLAQKQPLYKQLTISRENSKSLSVARNTTESPDQNGSDEDSGSAQAEQNTDEKDSAKRHASKLERDAASGMSMNHDRDSINLISNLVSRKAEDRQKQKLASPTVDQERSEGLSKDKQKLVEKFIRGGEHAQIVDDRFEDQESTVATTQTSEVAATYEHPLQVADFNKRLAELEGSKENRGDKVPLVVPEQRIPALVSSSPVPSSAFSSNVMNSTRSQRRPTEMATITIGDHTVMSTIGTPYPKRQRIDNSPDSSRGSRSTALLGGSLPSFGNRLSQRFAAPGTTQESASSQIGEEVDDEGQMEFASPRTDSPPLTIDEPSAIDQCQKEDDETMEDTLFVDSGPTATESTLADAAIDDDDGEYIDEDEQKVREEAKVQEMILAAEQEAARPSEENVWRAKLLLKGGSRKKDSTVHLVRPLSTTVSDIRRELQTLKRIISAYEQKKVVREEITTINMDSAEDRLTLTISKSDFSKMKIIGQFNLGFILASRVSDATTGPPSANDVFIIDQHASDEKYNFERLQATTIVQSQRLVRPKTLDLTAVEEEVVMENLSALETNGFIVSVDESGDSPVGQRCQLVSLPLSRETAFSITDLNELISLLSEYPAGSVPRPSKVRKMFAMRACRSSIMIGKTLTEKQMGKVVKHMGEIDKPWNCPHGRPTMRHLCGLGSWDELGWKEGGGLDGGKQDVTNWAAYVRQNRRESSPIETEMEAEEE